MKFKVTSGDKAALCRQAPEFAPAVAAIKLESFECEGDLFRALVWSVISQQLSGRVAQVLCDRVETLLGKVTPEAVSGATFEGLRGCGISARKIEYLKGIAAAAMDDSMNFERLASLPDTEIISELVKLKGVGVWTAEMLLIFALGRKDILSFRDLGIRSGIMRLHKLDRLTEDDFEFYRRRYSPYGTLASLYLWRIKDDGLPSEE